MKAIVAALGLALAAPEAFAFCIHNDLKDRDVMVVQEEHPDWKRQDNRFKQLIKPGANSCCDAKSLDCNPNGRQNSLVGMFVAVQTEPPLKCGPASVPDKMKVIKISGAGTMRIVANPRHDPNAKMATSPYIVRVWSHDNQDITGPSGLPCR